MPSISKIITIFIILGVFGHISKSGPANKEGYIPRLRLIEEFQTTILHLAMIWTMSSNFKFEVFFLNPNVTL